MNATQRLIEAAERLHHLHLCEQEGIRSGAPNPVDWYEAVDAIGMALAAAKEEQGKVLTDEEIGQICRDLHLLHSPGERVGAEIALRYARDHGYLAPAKGLDVEGVMKAIKEVVFLRDDQDERIRKALEANAEKGGDNLRTDTCEPDCRDHGGIEGCSCSECSTPLGPPVFMTYCGGCGKKVNWPEGTDMMPSEWAYPQRKDAEKEDSNLRKPWPYTPTEELARRVPPDTDKG